MQLTTLLNIILIMSFSLYLYLSGNEYTATTGGWMAQAWSGNSSLWTAYLLQLTKYPTYLRISIGHGDYLSRSGVVRTTNKIDLTAATFVNVTLSGGLTGKNDYQPTRVLLYLFVNSTTTGNWAVDTVAARTLLIDHNPTSTASTLVPSTTYSLDVSALTGTFYVCLGLTTIAELNPSYFDIGEVKLTVS